MRYARGEESYLKWKLGQSSAMEDVHLNHDVCT